MHSEKIACPQGTFLSNCMSMSKLQLCKSHVDMQFKTELHVHELNFLVMLFYQLEKKEGKEDTNAQTGTHKMSESPTTELVLPDNVGPSARADQPTHTTTAFVLFL